MKKSGSPPSPLCLLLVAGETSGDAHGAELIDALKRLHPGVRIVGAGGPRMAAAGQEQLIDLASHAVLGLVEVLRHIAKFRRFLRDLVDLAERVKPDAVVFIDCSGFNLRLAPRLRRAVPGARLIYYVSPQVWASRPGRVRVMTRTLDLLLSILPFEKAWFARVAPKFNVQWVGHPLLDRIRRQPEQPELFEPSETTIPCVALLPGSRRSEISAHLPILWETARLIAAEKKGMRFMLLSPSDEMLAFSRRLLAKLPSASFQLETNIGYAITHLSRCSLALVASGTASLECALVGIPQIVVYKVHPLTYAVGRMVVKVRHLSMVNILANEEVVPEFLQERLQPGPLAQAALGLLDDPERRQEMQARVAKVVATLGEPGAALRAARAILVEASFAAEK